MISKAQPPGIRERHTARSRIIEDLRPLQDNLRPLQDTVVEFIATTGPSRRLLGFLGRSGPVTSRSRRRAAARPMIPPIARSLRVVGRLGQRDDVADPLAGCIDDEHVTPEGLGPLRVKTGGGVEDVAAAAQGHGIVQRHAKAVPQVDVAVVRREVAFRRGNVIEEIAVGFKKGRRD